MKDSLQENLDSSTPNVPVLPPQCCFVHGGFALSNQAEAEMLIAFHAIIVNEQGLDGQDM